MNNVVENNNSFTSYNQIWSHYIFTDIIPSIPPLTSNADSKAILQNIDKTDYTQYIFHKKTDNEEYSYLIYLSNFQLIKEFRQGKSWKFEYNKDEETLRNIILPGTTSGRLYNPTFSNGEYEIPFTSLNPEFDLSNCRINVGLDFDKIYISCWLYVGKRLNNFLKDSSILPFNSSKWLLKDNKGNKIKFDITDERSYILPGDNLTKGESGNTIITTNILNESINTLGKLDEGEWW